MNFHISMNFMLMENISNSLTVTSDPLLTLEDFILKLSYSWGHNIIIPIMSYEHKFVWASTIMLYDWQHDKMNSKGSNDPLYLSFILMIFRLWELLLHYWQRNYNIIGLRDLLPQIFTGIDHKIDFFRLLKASLIGAYCVYPCNHN